MNELRPMQVIFGEKYTPFYVKDLGSGMLGRKSCELVDFCWD
jgi:hypothetical protein